MVANINILESNVFIAEPGKCIDLNKIKDILTDSYNQPVFHSFNS